MSEAEAAGVPVSGSDVASVFAMVLRTGARRLRRQLPMILAGVPILVLCFGAYASVYAAHFAPWDMMEEVPSQNPTIAVLRSAVELAWLLLLPLGLFSGWRTARRVRDGSYLLPAIYLVSLLVLITQAGTFKERNAWFGRSLRDSYVDDVSPYSVFMMAVVIALPLVFVVVELVTPKSATSLAPRQTIGESEHDVLALLAVVSPFLMLMFPLIWIAPFLFFTWSARSFNQILKAVASLAAVAPIAIALASSQVTRGPWFPLAWLWVMIALQLGVWVWMAITALRYRQNDSRQEILDASTPGMV